VDEPKRAQFLAFVCWFGAHKALRLGFWDVSWGMIRYEAPSSRDEWCLQNVFSHICVRVCRNWAQNCHFPLSQEQLAFQVRRHICSKLALIQ
jgi:hypothetical protein